MARRRTRKFKLGDVLERTNIGIINIPNPPIRLPQAGDKGIVVYPYFYQDFENIEDIPEENREYDTVYWYDHQRREHIHPEEVKPCAGLRNKRLCSTCKHEELCSHLREIALCDNSRFRREKINTDICKARNCRHLFYCGTNRFLEPWM